MKCDRHTHPHKLIGAAASGFLILFGLLVLPAAQAQQATNEQQAFTVAARAFSDGVFDVAEKDFAAFAQTFPQSPRVPEAILFRARAALEQGKLDTALNLLTTSVTNAGAFADQYRYWQGKVYLQSSNYQAAADTYALLAADFKDSVLLLEAAYNEALAWFKLGDYRKVVERLQRPDSAFQKAAKVRANNELVARGKLLLPEALLQLKEYQAAEQAIEQLPEASLIPEFKWRRQYLRCRIQLADNHPKEALGSTTNLLALAAAAGQPQYLAESLALQAGILHRLNDLEAAVRVYEKNLAAVVPAPYRRQALVHIIELTLARGRFAEATQRLQDFLTSHPDDAASDLALLTLGEVHLKLHTSGTVITNLATVATNAAAAVTNAPLAATNHLEVALAQFNQLINAFTNSPFLGKALLNRGWCLWLQDKLPDSMTAFKQATEHLALSEDLAVARFKLADAQFQLQDLTNALQNYQAVIKNFEAFPRVRNTLFDHALYQILRVSLQVNDLNDAADAMKKILEWFPDSDYRDRGMLLVGQGFTLDDHPVEGRALLADLVKRLPQSPLIPEIELAIARTYVQENNWNGAIGKYTQWLSQFPTNSLRPRAEFNRAWANYQAGQLTNALVLFTNFVAQFPQDQLAPRAQVPGGHVLLQPA